MHIAMSSNKLFALLILQTFVELSCNIGHRFLCPMIKWFLPRQMQCLFIAWELLVLSFQFPMFVKNCSVALEQSIIAMVPLLTIGAT